MNVVERELVVRNRLGLHARAAGKLVRVAERYTAKVLVEKDGQRADAKSVMGLLLLCGQVGTRLRIRAEGDDAADVVDAIAALVEDRFGEGA